MTAKRIDADLNFLALIYGMEMWWRMIAVKHANDDSVEAAQFRHGEQVSSVSIVWQDWRADRSARLRHGRRCCRATTIPWCTAFWVVTRGRKALNRSNRSRLNGQPLPEVYKSAVQPKLFLPALLCAFVASVFGPVAAEGAAGNSPAWRAIAVPGVWEETAGTNYDGIAGIAASWLCRRTGWAKT